MRFTIKNDVEKIKIKNLSYGDIFMAGSELFMIVSGSSACGITILYLETGRLININETDKMTFKGKFLFEDYEETEVYLMDCELIARKKQRI